MDESHASSEIQGQGLGPHTAGKDGGMRLKDYCIFTFNGFVEKNFYKFSENKFTKYLTIKTINYKFN
jgi:hypothetical protein